MITAHMQRREIAGFTILWFEFLVLAGNSPTLMVQDLLSIASRSRTGRKKAGLGGRRGDRVKLGIKKDLFIIKSVWSCPSFLEVPRAYNHESVWMKSQALLEGFNFLDTAHFSHIVLDMQIL